jgi:hypothetical protein
MVGSWFKASQEKKSETLSQKQAVNICNSCYEDGGRRRIKVKANPGEISGDSV